MPSLFGLRGMVATMTITVIVMVTSQAFSLCPSVQLMTVANLPGMLNLVHPHLPSPTAVVKHGVKTSRLLQLICTTHAQKVILGHQQLHLLRQVNVFVCSYEKLCKISIW